MKNFILRLINKKEMRVQNRMLGDSYFLYVKNAYSDEEWYKILTQYYPDILVKDDNVCNEIYAVIASEDAHLLYEGFVAYIMTEDGKTFEKV